MGSLWTDKTKCMAGHKDFRPYCGYCCMLHNEQRLCMFCDEFVTVDNGCAHDTMHHNSPSYSEYLARQNEKIANES